MKDLIFKVKNKEIYGLLHYFPNISTITFRFEDGVIKQYDVFNETIKNNFKNKKYELIKER